MFEDLPALSQSTPPPHGGGVVILPNSGIGQPHPASAAAALSNIAGSKSTSAALDEAFIRDTFSRLVIPQEELSDLRLELGDRTKTLHEAQQKLSDQRVMLQEEREKSARLLSENVSHHCQGEDDRARIAQLLRITRGELTDGAGVVEDVPLVVRPIPGQGKRLVKRANETMSLRSFVVKNGGKTTNHNDPNAAQSGGDPTDVEQRLVSALQAPPGSGLMIALRQELVECNEQLDLQRRTFELDREARMGDERCRFRQQEDSLLKYKKTVDHLQSMLNQTTKELCLYRHSAQQIERELRAEVETSRAHVLELEATLEKEKCRRTADMKESLYAAAVRSNDVLERVRFVARDKENCQQDKVRDATAANRRLEEEVARLRTSLKEAKRKTLTVEQRFRLQEDGLRSELDLCKQELRAVQKRVYFNFQRESSSLPQQQQPHPATGQHATTTTTTTGAQQQELPPPFQH